jgi:hypothetical protein
MAQDREGHDVQSCLKALKMYARFSVRGELSTCAAGFVDRGGEGCFVPVFANRGFAGESELDGVIVVNPFRIRPGEIPVA